MYGWRGRIGLVVPSSNTTMEAEFWRYVPYGVSVHVTRVALKRVTVEELRVMAEKAEEAAELLATAGVDVIVYGCTTGSLLEGVEWEKSLVKRMESRAGMPVITTARAVVEALRTLSAKDIVVVTPYIDELNEREKRFLEEAGFRVIRIVGMGIVDNREIGSVPPGKVYRMAKKVFVPEADALFISCTNLQTLPIIDTLEQDLGKPVVSSNSATLWAALRRIGIYEKLSCCGRLLRAS